MGRALGMSRTLLLAAWESAAEEYPVERREVSGGAHCLAGKGARALGPGLVSRMRSLAVR